LGTFPTGPVCYTRPHWSVGLGGVCFSWGGEGSLILKNLTLYRTVRTVLADDQPGWNSPQDLDSTFVGVVFHSRPSMRLVRRRLIWPCRRSPSRPPKDITASELETVNDHSPQHLHLPRDTCHLSRTVDGWLVLAVLFSGSRSYSSPAVIHNGAGLSGFSTHEDSKQYLSYSLAC
jgi:hypothetical protein